MKTTFYLALDDSERSMIIHSLNNLRNSLIEQENILTLLMKYLQRLSEPRKKNSKSFIRRIEL